VGRVAGKGAAAGMAAAAAREGGRDAGRSKGGAHATAVRRGGEGEWVVAAVVGLEGCMEGMACCWATAGRVVL